MLSDLSSLLSDVRGCTLCAGSMPAEPRPVFQARADARILLASQAPSRAVFETGIPFNDPSGDRLRSWLGVTKDEF